MFLGRIILSLLLTFSAGIYADTINPYPYPVVECNGCSMDEVESLASKLAKLDEVVTVAFVDAYKGVSYAYNVEKYIDKHSAIEGRDFKFVTVVTPIPVDPELVQGARQLREMLVEMWNLNSEERKEWLRQEAKKPLKPGQERIFVLEGQ